jgi:hypothetical protein
VTWALLPANGPARKPRRNDVLACRVAPSFPVFIQPEVSSGCFLPDVETKSAAQFYQIIAKCVSLNLGRYR